MTEAISQKDFRKLADLIEHELPAAAEEVRQARAQKEYSMLATATGGLANYDPDDLAGSRGSAKKETADARDAFESAGKREVEAWARLEAVKEAIRAYQVDIRDPENMSYDMSSPYNMSYRADGDYE